MSRIFSSGAVVGAAMLAMLCVESPAHAQEAAGKADTFTDALIPLVALEVGPLPDPVKVDGRGITWNGIELATQNARALDALVIDEPLGKVNVKRTLLLTLLGKIELDAQGKPAALADPAQQVWCKDSANPNASVDCYKDSDGDGKLDQRARGYLPRREALSLNRIGAFEAIAPIAYRRTKPAELPVYDIAYLVCGDVGPQIKFARRIKKPGALAYDFGACDNVATPVANASDAEPVLLLDQARIRIRTVDGVRTSQMIGGMPAGLVIGPLRTDRPVSDITHARRFSEEHDQALTELPDIYVSTPPSIARDPVRIGESFFSAEVRHNITGALHAAAIQHTLFKGKPNELIPAGARLYGMQMRNTRDSSNLDADIVWCWPAPANSTAKGGKCIARDAMNITRVLDVRDRFNVRSIGIGSGAPSVDDPIVDRDDAGFGEPIVLDIAVEKIAKKRITVLYHIDRASERNKPAHHVSLERARDGNGYLMVGLGVLVLEPLDAQAIRITEKLPVAVGGDADVDDAVALLRSSR